MSDIFLSYSSQDRETARALAGALERHGWSVWWDRRIPTGRDYADVIEKQLASARCVIVLWSAASVASEWVKTEAADAKDRNLLVPALIEPVRLPLEFRRIQAADLVGWQGDTTHAGYATLVGDLEGLLGEDVTAPAPVPRPGPAVPKIVEDVADGDDVAAAAAPPLGREIAPPRPHTQGGAGEGPGRERTPPAPKPRSLPALLLLGGGTAALGLIVAGLLLSGAISFRSAGDRNAVNENAGGPVVAQSPPSAQKEAAATPAGVRPARTPTPAPGAGGNINVDAGPPPSKRLPEIRRLLDSINTRDGATRKKALSALVADHATDPAAVAEALSRLDEKEYKKLLPEAMTDIMYFLNRADAAAWTPELLSRSQSQFRHLDRVEMEGEGLTQVVALQSRVKNMLSARGVQKPGR